MPRHTVAWGPCLHHIRIHTAFMLHLSASRTHTYCLYAALVCITHAYILPLCCTGLHHARIHTAFMLHRSASHIHNAFTLHVQLPYVFASLHLPSCGTCKCSQLAIDSHTCTHCLYTVHDYLTNATTKHIAILYIVKHTCSLCPCCTPSKTAWHPSQPTILARMPLSWHVITMYIHITNQNEFPAIQPQVSSHPPRANHLISTSQNPART
jgi:hypothetical protein